MKEEKCKERVSDMRYDRVIVVYCFTESVTV